jgi:hypothetical protein
MPEACRAKENINRLLLLHQIGITHCFLIEDAGQTYLKIIKINFILTSNVAAAVLAQSVFSIDHVELHI